LRIAQKAHCRQWTRVIRRVRWRRRDSVLRTTRSRTSVTPCPTVVCRTRAAHWLCCDRSVPVPSVDSDPPVSVSRSFTPSTRLFYGFWCSNVLFFDANKFLDNFLQRKVNEIILNSQPICTLEFPNFNWLLYWLCQAQIDQKKIKWFYRSLLKRECS
jgi:hypothetical protein